MKEQKTNKYKKRPKPGRLLVVETTNSIQIGMINKAGHLWLLSADGWLYSPEKVINWFYKAKGERRSNILDEDTLALHNEPKGERAPVEIDYT